MPELFRIGPERIRHLYDFMLARIISQLVAGVLLRSNNIKTISRLGAYSEREV
jgi:hypothetical protein